MGKFMDMAAKDPELAERVQTMKLRKELTDVIQRGFKDSLGAVSEIPEEYQTQYRDMVDENMRGMRPLAVKISNYISKLGYSEELSKGIAHAFADTGKELATKHGSSFLEKLEESVPEFLNMLEGNLINTLIKNAPEQAIEALLERGTAGLLAEGIMGSMLAEPNKPKDIFILAIEDEPTQKFIIEKVFEKKLSDSIKTVGKLEWAVVASTEEAQKIIEARNGAVSVVMTDNNMPGENGIPFAKRMFEQYPQIPFMLSSASNDKKVLEMPDANFVALAEKSNPLKMIEQLAKVVSPQEQPQITR